MRARLPRALTAVAAAVALAGGTACGNGGAGGARGPLTVLAASSLADVFTELGPRFTAQQQVAVRFSFGASSAIVRQLHEGAPADVIVTADDVTMASAVEAQDVEGPVVFARNELEIAVPAGNPHRVRSVKDLSRPDLVVVACAAEAPCGRLANAAFAKARAEVKVRSFEPDVAAVLAKVRSGDADAGLVYVTTVRGARGVVEGVALGDGIRETAPDLVSIARRTTRRASAEAFVRFLLSAPTQQTLRAAGFGEP